MMTSTLPYPLIDIDIHTYMYVMYIYIYIICHLRVESGLCRFFRRGGMTQLWQLSFKRHSLSRLVASYDQLIQLYAPKQIYIYIYIYIWKREREREREEDKIEKKREVGM